jgi:hypothetical protein
LKIDILGRLSVSAYLLQFLPTRKKKSKYMSIQITTVSDVAASIPSGFEVLHCVGADQYGNDHEWYEVVDSRGNVLGIYLTIESVLDSNKGEVS